MLGEPSPAVRRLWVVLHGYGQLAARLARHCTPLAAPGALVVLPEALSRFYVEAARGGSHAHARVGATWMTREDRLAEIGDYVAYLDLLHARLLELCGADEPPALHVLGFSQGAAAAARWAAHGVAPVRSLVAWGALLPDDVDAARLRERLAGAPLTLVCGIGDEVRAPDGVRAQAERLREAGLPAAFRSYEGGLRLHAPTLAALADEAARRDEPA